MKKYVWIDFLKGISIIGIIAVHTNKEGLEDHVSAILNLGKYGVEFFFIMSAFLSFQSYERIYNQQKSAIKWVAVKLLRIVPLFYLALITYSILNCKYLYWLGSMDKVSIFNILSHISLTHALFPHYMNSMMGVEWYIGILAIIYIITPMLYKIFNSSIRIFIGLFLSLAINTFLHIMTIHHFSGKSDFYLYANYIEHFSLLAQFPIILLGFLLFHICKSSAKTILNSSLFHLICALFILCIIPIVHTRIPSVSSTFFFGLFAFFISCALSKWDNFKCHKFSLIIALGKNTYPMYLIHLLIINIVTAVIPNISGNIYIDYTIRFITTIIISFLLSIAINELIDKPTQKIIKKQFTA